MFPAPLIIKIMFHPITHFTHIVSFGQYIFLKKCNVREAIVKLYT
jgi:hypothetical protein